MHAYVSTQKVVGPAKLIGTLLTNVLLLFQCDFSLHYDFTVHT